MLKKIDPTISTILVAAGLAFVGGFAVNAISNNETLFSSVAGSAHAELGSRPAVGSVGYRSSRTEGRRGPDSR